GIDKVDEQNRTNRRELHLFSDLIDNSSRKWRSDLINSTFQEDTARKILQIPLAETKQEDTQVWKGELSDRKKDFYKKLWSLQLPSKIAIIIWRISWDYIPHLANLRFKRVTSNDCCPRCGSGVEESLHVFRECPFTREVWQSLNLSWVMDNTIQNIWEWLTWVFKSSSNNQCQLFCYALWLIWSFRNKFIHEGRNTTGRGLAQNIQRHMTEYEGIKVVKKIERIYRGYRIQEDVPRIMIQFDAALDSRTFKSATGLVGWDMRGNLLVLKTVIHRNVPSPLATEAYACLEGIKLGIALRTQSVRIMEDSK
ncbi:hypothetical protein Goarm_022764, partial [Gossypium armourianum]|nr:hypothetical protein [Gossypium armourianum]